MICLVVADRYWILRVFFGGVALLAVLLTIHGLKNESKHNPGGDEGSVLHINQT
jgi:hypothetical protein